MATSDNEDLPARIRAVEESLGFAERAVEQLSLEIAGLNRQLAQTHSRVQRLEAQLQRLLEPPQADGESPSA